MVRFYNLSVKKSRGGYREGNKVAFSVTSSFVAGKISAKAFCRRVPARTFLQVYAACTAITFFSRGKTAPLVSLVVILFCVRKLSAKTIAGLLSPRPRFLSCRKERNQRFAKEEVSSLDSPPRGTSPRELRIVKFSPPICSASERMSNTDVPLRTAECLCRAHFLPIQRGFKGGQV